MPAAPTAAKPGRKKALIARAVPSAKPDSGAQAAAADQPSKQVITDDKPEPKYEHIVVCANTRHGTADTVEFGEKR